MSVSRPLLLGLGGLALLGVVQWVILPAFEYRADNASRAERARQRHLSMQLLTDDYALFQPPRSPCPRRRGKNARAPVPHPGEGGAGLPRPPPSSRIRPPDGCSAAKSPRRFSQMQSSDPQRPYQTGTATEFRPVHSPQPQPKTARRPVSSACRPVHPALSASPSAHPPFSFAHGHYTPAPAFSPESPGCKRRASRPPFSG